MNARTEAVSPVEREVRRRQVTMALAEDPAKTFGMAALVIVVALVMRDAANPVIVYSWAVLQTLLNLSGFTLWQAYRRGIDDLERTLRFGRWYIANGLLFGLCWGIGSALMFVPGRIEYQLYLGANLMVLCALAAGVHAVLWPLFQVYLLTSTLPFLLRLVIGGGRTELLVALSGIIGILYFHFAGRRFTARSAQTIRTQIENDRLAGRLAILQSRLSGAIETVSAAFVIFDRNDRLLVANEKFHQLLGPLELPLVPGTTVYADLVRAAIDRGLFVEAESAAGSAIDAAMLGVRKHGLPIELRLSDDRWIRLDSRTTADGDLVMIVTDVTDMRLRAAALAAGEHRLRAITETVADAIVTTDANGLIESVNRAAGQMFGHRSEALVGQPLSLLLPDATPEMIAGLDAQSQASPGSAGREFAARRRDGGQLPVEVTVGGAEIDGNRRYVAVLRDISERKAQQAQLTQSSKLVSLGEIATGLAHELNQPLNIIRMAADSCLILMADGMADADFQRNQLGLISGQTVRMAKIIEHMRVFGRKDSADAVPFSPIDSVRSALRLVQQQFRVADIAVSLSVPVECRQVQGFPLRLEQVLLNLLNNARDAILARPHLAGGDGGLIGRIDITVLDSPDADDIAIVVSDTGGGMPNQVLERVFDPFFTTKEAGKGTGLGLSISYAIISDMGGRLSVRNGAEGAEFTVSLPARREGAA